MRESLRIDYFSGAKRPWKGRTVPLGGVDESRMLPELTVFPMTLGATDFQQLSYKRGWALR